MRKPINHRYRCCVCQIVSQMFEQLGTIHPLSILIRQHSQHTICNEVLMKGEYGRLPASLSALQSAHVIGGRVGSAAAYSSVPAHTHSLSKLPKKRLHIPLQLCHKPRVTLQLPQWHWHNEKPQRYRVKVVRIWHKSSLWWSVRDKGQVSHNWEGHLILWKIHIGLF